MADSTRETALKALEAALRTISGPTILRNEADPVDLPADGLIVLLDGDPGEPEVWLSPPEYAYTHQAEIIVQVQHAVAATRDTLLDVLLQAIVTAVEADDTLGGAVDNAQLRAPSFASEPIEGAATIKAARVPASLEYVTASPLG